MRRGLPGDVPVRPRRVRHYIGIPFRDTEGLHRVSAAYNAAVPVASPGGKGGMQRPPLPEAASRPGQEVHVRGDGPHGTGTDKVQVVRGPEVPDRDREGRPHHALQTLWGRLSPPGPGGAGVEHRRVSGQPVHEGRYAGGQLEVRCLGFREVPG